MSRYMRVQVFHPFDTELRELKRHYGKEALSDPEFIQWLVHYVYLLLADGGLIG